MAGPALAVPVPEWALNLAALHSIEVRWSVQDGHWGQLYFARPFTSKTRSPPGLYWEKSMDPQQFLFEFNRWINL